MNQEIQPLKGKGEFIAFLDADDLWCSNKLFLQKKKFKDPKVGLVYGKYLKINEYSLLRRKQLITKKQLPEGYITNNLLKFYSVGLLTIVLRKNFSAAQKFSKLNITILEILILF